MKIVQKIDRCNETRALARMLANCFVSASKDDVQSVPGRVRTSKVEVGGAKFERKTLEGRKKTDRERQKSEKARQEHAKAGRGPESPLPKSGIIRKDSMGAPSTLAEVSGKVHTAEAATASASESTNC